MEVGVVTAEVWEGLEEEEELELDELDEEEVGVEVVGLFTFVNTGTCPFCTTFPELHT